MKLVLARRPAPIGVAQAAEDVRRARHVPLDQSQVWWIRQFLHTCVRLPPGMSKKAVAYVVETVRHIPDEDAVRFPASLLSKGSLLGVNVHAELGGIIAPPSVLEGVSDLPADRYRAKNVSACLAEHFGIPVEDVDPRVSEYQRFLRVLSEHQDVRLRDLLELDTSLRWARRVLQNSPLDCCHLLPASTPLEHCMQAQISESALRGRCPVGLCGLKNADEPILGFVDLTIRCLRCGGSGPCACRAVVSR